jgi:scavenger receptor class B protein 1
MLQKKIDASMALEPNSDRLASWLKPPVQAHLTGYAFHVTNPKEVLLGAKPKLEEKGPYVYKAETIKDTEGMKWSDDNTELKYRPRRVYSYVSELSGDGLDPDKDMVTVPNIPLWTGLSRVSGKLIKLETTFNITFHFT